MGVHKAHRVYSSDRTVDPLQKRRRRRRNRTLLRTQPLVAVTHSSWVLSGLAVSEPWRDRTKLLNRLGLCCNRLRRPSEAIAYFRQSLKLCSPQGYSDDIMTALNGMGNAHHDLGEYREAMECHQEHCLIAQSIDDRSSIASALGNIGIVYDSLGEYRTALEHHRAHLGIAQAIDDQHGVMSALGNAGLAHQNLGEFGDAIENHQESLRIAQALDDTDGILCALSGLGIACLRTGDGRKAVQYHQEHLRIAQAVGDPDIGGAYGNLGNAYHSVGEYTKASECHEQRLHVAQAIGDLRGIATALGNLGGALHRLGEYSAAVEYHQELLCISQEMGNRSGVGVALCNMGIAYKNLGEYEKAIEHLQEYFHVSASMEDIEGVQKALYNITNVYLCVYNFDDADASLTTSIQCVDTLIGNIGDDDRRKMQYLEAHGRIYSFLESVRFERMRALASVSEDDWDGLLAAGECRRFPVLSQQLQGDALPWGMQRIMDCARGQRAALLVLSTTTDCWDRIAVVAIFVPRDGPPRRQVLYNVPFPTGASLARAGTACAA